MIPLQEAAKAAKGRLWMKECARCQGSGACFEGRMTCAVCDGCGVDTSNPYEVLGRAIGCLFTNHRHPAVWQTGASALVDFLTRIEEPHNGTAEGVATALLRLVDRCAR